MKPLTKSRFVLAATCSTKLYYANHAEFPDKREADEFTEALADGGYQVGELAKCMHPDGVDLGLLGIDHAIAETMSLLKRENVVIFEAAIAWNDCLVKVDVLIKQGKRIRLIEVKAKSIDSSEGTSLVGKRGGITSKWKRYLFDVAFQHYVLSGAFVIPPFSAGRFSRNYAASLTVAGGMPPTAVFGLSLL